MLNFKFAENIVHFPIFLINLALEDWEWQCYINTVFAPNIVTDGQFSVSNRKFENLNCYRWRGYESQERMKWWQH